MSPSGSAQTALRVTPSTLLALLGIQITFASNYLFSKIVMQSLPPLVWGFIRTLCTTGILLAFLGLKRQLHLEKVWALKKEFILFSLLGVVINQASFLAGLKLTTTANSGLINTMIPVFTVLWVTLAKKESFSFFRWIGFCLSFAGVLLLQDLQHFSLSLATYRGDAFTLLNAFSYSLFLLLSPPFFKNESPIWITTWLFFFGSFALAILSIPQWTLLDFASVSSATLLFGALGVLLGNLVPYLLISYVLSRTASSIIAQFVYLQALVAGFLGYVFLNESISSRTIFSASIIFLGLYFTLATVPFGIRLTRKKP